MASEPPRKELPRLGKVLVWTSGIGAVLCVPVSIALSWTLTAEHVQTVRAWVLGSAAVLLLTTTMLCAWIAKQRYARDGDGR